MMATLFLIHQIIQFPSSLFNFHYYLRYVYYYAHLYFWRVDICQARNLVDWPSWADPYPLWALWTAHAKLVCAPWPFIALRSPCFQSQERKALRAFQRPFQHQACFGLWSGPDAPMAASGLQEPRWTILTLYFLLLCLSLYDFLFIASLATAKFPWTFCFNISLQFLLLLL